MTDVTVISTDSGTALDLATGTIDRFKISSVSDAQWADAASTEIRCNVVFPNMPTVAASPVPFMARADDAAAHGRQLYADLVAGKFGAIEAYVAPPATPEEQYQSAIQAGIVVTSASTPALNGTYGVEASDQANISAEAQFISQYQEFTNGQGTFSWSDQSGSLHTFPNTGLFMAFAKAVARYVSACKQAKLSSDSGVSRIYPSNSAEIG